MTNPMLLTVSNLFPRPDQPGRGLFNWQLFNAFADQIALHNVCLVPSLRLDRWQAIANWQMPQPAKFTTRYAPTFHVPVVGRNISWRFQLSALRRQPIDVDAVRAVYATWLYPDAVAAAHFAASINVPCWIMVQGSDVFHLDHPARRKAVLAADSFVNGYLCLGDHLAERLIRSGLPPHKMHVISNGVDKHKFAPRSRAAARTQLGLSQSDAIVLSVGNLVAVKGPDVLLDAWQRVVNRDTPRQSSEADPATQRRLVFVGDGDLRETLQTATVRDGTSESVVFAGRVPHDQIPVWMNAADVLCLSSRHEGMPNVILEAMASGMKVVSTDVGACRFLLGDYPPGRIADRENPESLAHALNEVLGIAVADGDLTDVIACIPSWETQARQFLQLMRLA